MIQEVKEHLTAKIIPFWQQMKDIKYGGYYGFMDFDLNINPTAVKGCILNSRILWFFSNAFMILQDPTLLEDADYAFLFLKNQCYDIENGGIFWSLNYDGSVCDSTKHTYNLAFGIYALSSYYDATKSMEVLSMAKSLFQVIESKCKDEFGYMEAFDRKFRPVSNEKLSENGVQAEKTMNTLLHVMEAYTELYRVTKDDEVRQCLVWILRTIKEKIYNRAKHRQEVFFNYRYESILDLHSYGHDIETAWLIDRTCEILGDSKLTAAMGEITSDLEREIYEKAYHKHSLWNECEKGVVDKSRIWWVQAEGVVGFLNAYQKDKSKKEYMQAVLNLWQYIKEKLVDQRVGSEWFWKLDDEGKPSSKQPIVEPWKCPYHNGRMCFEIIRRNVDVT